MRKRKRAPNLNVFINCPFDSEYEPLFRAICFTCLACGYAPRSALEYSGSEQPRFSRIVTLISESDFGIHDISRTQLSESGLPRFNMPFELGLYLGCIRFGGRNHESKRALVLDSEAYRYQQYLSDLAGNDPDAHHNDAAVVIEKVRGWLQSVCEEQLPGPVHIRDSYRYFEQAYPAMAGARGLATGAVPYSDVVYTMREWMTSYVLGRRVGG